MEIPEEIRELYNLHYLDIEGNPFDSLPSSLLDLRNLKSLSLNIHAKFAKQTK